MDAVRIAIRPAFFPGAAGGVEPYVQGLAAALSALAGTDRFDFVGTMPQRASIEPFISEPAAWVTVPGTTNAVRTRVTTTAIGRVAVRVRRWARQHAGDADAYRPNAPAVVEEGGYDVIHFAAQAGERTSLPNVYQPWDLQHLHHPEFFTKAQLRHRELIWGPSCRRATYVLVASTFVKDDVANAFAIDPARIAVVPPGPALRVTSRKHEPHQPFALYPGQTWEHKNHLRLIDAIAALRARGTEVRLVCPGQPNARDATVRAHARSRGVEDLLDMPGFVSSEALAALYASARCLLLPSLFEGFGFPVLEAFAAGLPVACADATSLPELAGDAAVLFDPNDADAIADAVERIWTDDALRSELAARGSKRAERYSWDHLAQSCRALYRTAAGVGLTMEDESLLRLAGAE